MTLFELDILYFLQEILKNDFLDSFMPKVTSLGNAGALWIGIAVVLLIFKKTRQTGLVMAAAMLCCFVFGNLILKNVIDRPRPYVVDPNIVLLIKPSIEAGSFPSGHTMNAFSAAFVLTFRQEKFYGWAMMLAIVIAFSRIYLMMHFPTDVLGGIVIAYIAAELCCRFVPPVFDDN